MSTYNLFTVPSDFSNNDEFTKIALIHIINVEGESWIIQTIDDILKCTSDESKQLYLFADRIQSLSIEPICHNDFQDNIVSDIVKTVVYSKIDFYEIAKTLIMQYKSLIG